MFKYSGQIVKMTTKFDHPIGYSLPIGNEFIQLNEFIGHEITIDFKGDIYCIECNTKIKKTFMQGFCYPCFINSPYTSECILKPHLCQAHDGIARDMDWAKKYCLDTHYVYLALTSNLKVGVTRSTQIPTRWIDQGAHFAIKFAKTPNRYLAGLIEIEISKHISDRTQWTRMLKKDFEYCDLKEKKEHYKKLLPKKLQEYISQNEQIFELQYPDYAKFNTIKSVNLDKTPQVIGQFTGIKGQYLIIDNKYVMNVRKYTGYVLNIAFSDLAYNPI